MTASLLLSWREGVSASVEGGGLRVQGHAASVVLRRLDQAVLAAFARLDPPGEEEGRLAELAQEGGPAALAAWYYWLLGLTRRGLVCRSVQAGGRLLASVAATGDGFTLAQVSAEPDRKYALSRFAYLRREGDALVLESPLAPCRVTLDVGAAALLWALAQPGTPAELAGRAGGSPEEVTALLGLLNSAGLLQEVASEGAGEGEPAALRSWEFHDLLFHARSREGRTDAPFGATYRMAGLLDPPPAVKPAVPAESYALYRPDLERLAREDPPLAQVVEGRRSLRTYGPRPLSAGQLGEFLYRVARVKDSYEAEMDTPCGPVRMAFTSRPYPAGGALYELEFYAVANACDGLAPGLYHYEPQGHALDRLSGRTAEVEQLLADAAASAGIPRESPQVLLILAARFPRVAWKYSSIAYALILKHVGVVYQTMYLTATAMGLAPCALGGGDADLFARAAGTDYYAETSVGEFLLGSGPGDG